MFNSDSNDSEQAASRAPSPAEPPAGNQMNASIYQWDHHSDQPHIIRNRRAKRQLYRLGALGSLKTVITAIIALPLVWLLKKFSKPFALPAAASGIGICVNMESVLADKTTVASSELAALVDELDIGHVLIRVPLWQANNLDNLLDLATKLRGKTLLIEILQDRSHITNPQHLQQNLRKIFTAFGQTGKQFKIGNAVNRRKWAFVSLDEYFRFFQVAQRLRDTEFPHLQLLGGSIIDFELPNFARALLHFFPFRYDGVAAQLYVDRRGAPENTQFGANLLSKIQWFDQILRLSRKAEPKLHITETNWPLLGTEPFAPAVGDCMVNEDQQAAYLARYYLLAFASGKVKSVYWHQLIAPGYGLIDNRITAGNAETPFRKRRAFYALKTLARLFNNTTILHYEQRGEVYTLTASRQAQRITALWTNNIDHTIETSALQVLHASPASESIEILGLCGESITHRSSLTINGDVTYFVQQLKDEPHG